MSEPVLRTAYWDDPEARRAFKEFLAEIHGLDLTPWEEAGYWDDLYRPFSFFDRGRVVSNVCLYSMDMTVAGERRRVAQVSAVGTRPEYRRRGLSGRLTELALDWAAPGHHGAFLFADEGALAFYAARGFEPVEERIPVLAVDPPPVRPGLRRLDPDDPADRGRIWDLAQRRSPVSDRLGVQNPRLLMFFFLQLFREGTFLVPDPEAVVFLKREPDRLTLFDVIAGRMPSFAELHPYLAGAPHGEVRFRFPVDRLGVEPTRWEPLVGNNAHVRAPFALPAGAGCFPFTAQA